MRDQKIPDLLKEAKDAFKAEVKAIHTAKHTISDFDDFAKQTRLELQSACERLARRNPRFVFKLGEVRIVEDKEVNKKFIHGSAYVGPRKNDKSSFFVRLDFTLANEAAQ